MSELFRRAVQHGIRPAIRTAAGKVHSYNDLLRDSAALASNLLAANRTGDLAGERVAFLCHADYDYVRTQWGIWRAGGVAVPLCTTHPVAELEYAISACKTGLVIGADGFADIAKRAAKATRFLSLPTASTGATVNDSELPAVGEERPAMILYTSGTTGAPKGAVTTHKNIHAQVKSLVEAWQWSPADQILNVLPLHHLHGVVNVVTCALWSGAQCEMHKFDPALVWQRFTSSDPPSLFMAVPTIYGRLIKEFEQMSPEQQQRASAAVRRLRLMVSGSAALPETTLQRWRDISGHTLLERYGMTEIGMALSNPYVGERIPGSVGFPLPGVKVKLAEDGELRIKSDQVFSEYFGLPEKTRETFDEDSWFKTGDIVSRDSTGRFRILGRASVDIIKSGGEKISALDIETTLRLHPNIAECAVVGLPDSDWGQRVAVVLVTKQGPLELKQLQDWCRDKLAPYKIPREMLSLKEIPTNAMGKVNKKSLVPLFSEHTNK
eukprot:gnl/Hemi2/26991_TR9067_c0_g1_i1.p1 gnl/Hemi2/26991_TR9067_c0_g1~~gnl/Hemi2/26991_TR9067_c0_g1_i1.p1  ORF type:complete len:494 (+),score=92.39 gnl/Hemi2/26991_TR9067_c0_g1_i1:128-1609(+)